MEKLYCRRISPCLALIRIPYLSFGGETAFTNVYLIIDKELVLIDAGPWRNFYFDILSSSLDQLGLSVRDISRIIYTHAHPDHMGGGIELNKHQEFYHSIYWEAQKQVEKYGHYATRVKSISKEIFFNHLSLYPAQKDIYSDVADSFWRPTCGEIKIVHSLHDGEIVSTGKLKFEVVFTPGHSPWDISLWEERTAMLFSGDFLLRKSTTLTGGLRGFGSDLKAYESSLQKIRKYLAKAKCVFPSHGPSIMSCSNLADDLLRIIKWREDRILQGLSKKNQRTDLMNILLSSNQGPLALVRQLGVTLTHLEKLEKQGRVLRSRDGERILYQLPQKQISGQLNTT